MSTPELSRPLDATVTTTVPAATGWVSTDVMAREGMSMLERFCDQVRPRSRLRKMPPPVVPTYISLGLTSEISMAEIGVPSNDGDTGRQLLPLLSVRHRRLEPAHRLFMP